MKVNSKNNAPYRRQAKVDTMALAWPRCKKPRLSRKTIRLFLPRCGGDVDPFRLPLRSARQFVGQNIHPLNFRWLGEQVRSFRHQGLGDLAIKVRIAAGLARKGVEDAEDVRTHPERKPCGRLRLLVHKRKGADQEVGDLLLLARLCFEMHIERVFGHSVPALTRARSPG